MPQSKVLEWKYLADEIANKLKKTKKYEVKILKVTSFISGEEYIREKGKKTKIRRIKESRVVGYVVRWYPRIKR